MATVQVRNVPDDVYTTLRARAAVAGLSLQEYLLGELSRSARLRSPAEMIAEVEQRLHIGSQDGFSRISAVEAIRADRESH